MNLTSILIGLFIGYVLSRIVNYLTARGTTLRIIAAAQIQALRLLSSSINHYYKLRLWHDKVGWSIDDAQRKLKETMLNDAGVIVRLPNGTEGFVRMTQEDLEEAAENWTASRVEELKLVWNIIEQEQKDWETESTFMMHLALGPYIHYCSWDTWGEAMEFLARYELLELEYRNSEKNG